MATKYIEEFPSTADFLARTPDRSNKLAIGSVAETLYVNKGGLAVPVTIGAGRVARGTATLDGTNPTPVATGLTTIVAATATLKSTAAPGLDPTLITVGYSGTDGTLNLYAWKPTGAGDATLIASTNATATVDWVASGT